VAVAVAAVLAGLLTAAVARTSGNVASGVAAANTAGAPGAVVVHWAGVQARGSAAKHWTLGAMRAAAWRGGPGTVQAGEPVAPAYADRVGLCVVI
jgi:hypothetical protein